MSSPSPPASASSVEEDVHRIKKKLDKMMKQNQIDVPISLDMLNALKKLPIDLNILKNTGVGVALNNLRKSCDNEELCNVTKALLKNWKKLVSSVDTSGGATASSQPSPSVDDSPSSSANFDSSTAAISNGEKATTNNSSENGSGGGKVAVKRTANLISRTQIPYTDTKDVTRLKCREMLMQALELTETIENGAELLDAKQIACACEDLIFDEFKNTDMKYKNRVRSRVLNLKDAKNPTFKENVRLGIITPKQLAKMSAEEMASKELKELRAKFTQEAINDHQMARKMATKSVLVCNKCKKNNVHYHEMQTRSADEPMTVFANCLECGHRWRM